MFPLTFLIGISRLLIIFYFSFLDAEIFRKAFENGKKFVTEHLADIPDSDEENNNEEEGANGDSEQKTDETEEVVSKLENVKLIENGGDEEKISNLNKTDLGTVDKGVESTAL